MRRTNKVHSFVKDMFFVLANEGVNPNIQKLAEDWQINRGKFSESIELSFENKMVLCESSTILQINLRYGLHKLLSFSKKLIII